MTLWQEYKLACKTVWFTPYLLMGIVLYPLVTATLENKWEWYQYFYLLIIPVFIFCITCERRLTHAKLGNKS